MVEGLVHRGWNVTILDLNEEAGHQTAGRLGFQVLFVRGNVIDYDEQVNAFAQTWQKWGRVDFGKFLTLPLEICSKS